MIRTLLPSLGLALLAPPLAALECYDLAGTTVSFCPDAEVFDGWTFAEMETRIQGADAGTVQLVTIMRHDPERLTPEALREAANEVAQSFLDRGMDAMQPLLQDRPAHPGAETARLAFLVGGGDSISAITVTLVGAPAGTFLVQTGVREAGYVTEAHSGFAAAALEALRGLEGVD
ncbi:hypothetical protein [Histidinibacterium lentulum]|uniref:DUF1795 domain-containing protein n=1 Tax=Histidinibacterium lentulum TaxID=2480588 RepID=A0A3N2R984_9RHOB|nr:hypothetical protein [Histidinibacterium lentulum]ROU03973.1 hypothetical protein EAT49_00795 [Histidinibacterium lentulum]